MSAVKPLAMVIFVCGLSPLTSCLAQDRVENKIPDWGTFIDPDQDCTFSLDTKQLSITVPGTPHDLSAELKRMNAPRIVRPVKGDFTLAVIVNGEFEPGQANIPGRTAYNGAGLLVMLDEKTYIRLERDGELYVGVAAINASSTLFEARFSGLVIEEK